MTKSTLKRRSESAEKIDKQLKRLHSDYIKKLPSFTGKSRFADRLRNLIAYTHLLSVDLDIDLKKFGSE